MSTHFAILPADLVQLLTSSPDKDARLDFLRLPHPRTGLLALFLPTQQLPSPPTPRIGPGILEVQSINPPDERSWILNEDIFADGKMLTMTPIDPTFLLLPLLRRIGASTDTASQFRTSDDIIEEAVTKLISLSNASNDGKRLREDILRFCTLDCTRQALARICESKELSLEITVYRFSLEKTLKYLRAKVAHLETCSQFNSSEALTRHFARDGFMEDGNEDMLAVGRTRACCDLIAHYLPPDLREKLLKSYDFAELQKFLDLKKEEAMRLAAANAPPTKSRGKGAKGKAGEKEASTAKKRKATKASHGVETLKKVNTTNMPKISSFFAKKP